LLFRNVEHQSDTLVYTRFGLGDHFTLAIRGVTQRALAHIINTLPSPQRVLMLSARVCTIPVQLAFLADNLFKAVTWIESMARALVLVVYDRGPIFLAIAIDFASSILICETAETDELAAARVPGVSIHV